MLARADARDPLGIDTHVGVREAAADDAFQIIGDAERKLADASNAERFTILDQVKRDFGKYTKELQSVEKSDDPFKVRVGREMRDSFERFYENARQHLQSEELWGKAGADQYLDNVLASAQGAITGEKFECFEVAFVGAGDTLAAALAALLASGAELHAAVGEALTFLDQSLDAGFRPGMGNVVPDRFFWALPPAEEGEGGEGAADDASPDDDNNTPKGPRHVH